MARVSHPLLRSIGQTIRALRRQQGLTQEALADRAQIDRSYMSSIERGLRNLSVLNVARIAAALEVPFCQLVKGRGAADDLRLDAALDDYAAVLGDRRVPAPVPVPQALRDKPLIEWEVGCSLSLG